MDTRDDSEMYKRWAQRNRMGGCSDEVIRQLMSLDTARRLIHDVVRCLRDNTKLGYLRCDEPEEFQKWLDRIAARGASL